MCWACPPSRSLAALPTPAFRSDCRLPVRRKQTRWCCGWRTPINGKPTGIGERQRSADVGSVLPRLAFLARADIAQVIPGVDAVHVTVVPSEADGVAPHRFDLGGLHRLTKHGQLAHGSFRILAGSAPLIVPFFIAERAG